MIRRLIVLSVLFSAAALAVESSGRRWWGHVQYLASDKLEGRLTGSEGHRKAAEYIAAKFKEFGLRPAGESGYFQPVEFFTRVLREQESSVALVRGSATRSLALGDDAIISLRVRPAEAVDAPIVFAGYGLTVPELGYDDLTGLDLGGKVVAYLYGGPAAIPAALKSHYQSLEERWKFLRRAGAIGTITIMDPRHMDIPWDRIKVLRQQPAMSLADASLDEAPGQQISLVINPASAEKLFADSGHSFSEILDAAAAEKPLPRFPLGCALKGLVRFDEQKVESQNVASTLPGTDPKLKDEFVVLSAHLDHLGVGEPIHGDNIYNGAMDNASGVATILEVAESLHESKTALGRSLLFLAFTGEEKGLLGSRYFVAHPTIKREAMVGNLNVDMFLPIFPLRILTVLGLRESDLGPLASSVADSMGLKVQDDPEPERNLFIRSDQYNFIRTGVPAIYFKVGFEKGSPEAATAKKWLTERYHAPSDDANQPVDLEAAAKYNEFVMKMVQAMANRSERPQWKPDSFFRRYAK